jgi:hypothetical protein
MSDHDCLISVHLYYPSMPDHVPKCSPQLQVSTSDTVILPLTNKPIVAMHVMLCYSIKDAAKQTDKHPTLFFYHS